MGVERLPDAHRPADRAGQPVLPAQHQQGAHPRRGRPVWRPARRLAAAELPDLAAAAQRGWRRSEEHTSELQSLMRISYAVFCLKKKNILYTITQYTIRNRTTDN